MTVRPVKNRSSAKGLPVAQAVHLSGRCVGTMRGGGLIAAAAAHFRDPGTKLALAYGMPLWMRPMLVCRCAKLEFEIAWLDCATRRQYRAWEFCPTHRRCAPHDPARLSHCVLTVQAPLPFQSRS
jgi:hypothetical protein